MVTTKCDNATPFLQPIRIFAEPQPRAKPVVPVSSLTAYLAENRLRTLIAHLQMAVFFKVALTVPRQDSRSASTESVTQGFQIIKQTN
jgi:hypothetical protein